ncbi:hypothetical protein GCWU000341_01133 [Oribacterium sp. oral taxon 078 str. F0262]|nr:hypothetical protein GCWU000341_01133 [Oribacterium sp. oral taxon 078 str. F0262]
MYTIEDPFVSDLQENFYALLRVLKPRLSGVRMPEMSAASSIVAIL